MHAHCLMVSFLQCNHSILHCVWQVAELEAELAMLKHHQAQKQDTATDMSSPIRSARVVDACVSPLHQPQPVAPPPPSPLVKGLQQHVAELQAEVQQLQQQVGQACQDCTKWQDLGFRTICTGLV